MGSTRSHFAGNDRFGASCPLRWATVGFGTSADALRAAEAALVARAEAGQRQYGVGWEPVARLLVPVRDGVDPDSVTARVVWSPADTRSQAQEADYAVKLYSPDILPVGCPQALSA